MLTGRTEFCPNDSVLNVYFFKNSKEYIYEGHVRLSTGLTNYSKSSARGVYFAFYDTYKKLEKQVRRYTISLKAII